MAVYASILMAVAASWEYQGANLMPRGTPSQERAGHPCDFLILQASIQAPPTTMSQDQSTSTSSMNFQAIFTAALKAYNKQTKKDIATHPLAIQLQSCDSPSTILTVLRSQVQAFDESQNADEKLTKWLDPTVNVLYAFSATLGNGVGLVRRESHSRSIYTVLSV